MENVRITGVDVLKIYNAQNQMEAEMLTAALKDHGIDCYSQTADAGEYMQIKTGLSVYGFDIFVKENVAESAKKIIEDILENSISDTGKRTEQYSVPWYKNSVMAARVLLIGAVVVTGLGILIIKEL